LFWIRLGRLLKKMTLRKIIRMSKSKRMLKWEKNLNLKATEKIFLNANVLIIS